jgi:hypothetical protein
MLGARPEPLNLPLLPQLTLALAPSAPPARAGSCLGAKQAVCLCLELAESRLADSGDRDAEADIASAWGRGSPRPEGDRPQLAMSNSNDPKRADAVTPVNG